jgi:endonuclease YncB( thermonuclease family)
MLSKSLLASLVLVTGTAAAAPCPSGFLIGNVTSVRDGDTIVVGHMPIRLNRLGSPEGGEPGSAAPVDATRLVEGQILRCELNGERADDRCLGTCYRR